MEEKEKGRSKKAEEQEESEYGKGLCYCIGLFLAHADRDFWGKIDRPKKGEKRSEIQKIMEKTDAEMWFNSASDHLYDLQIEAAPEELRDRLEIFRDLCINWGHGFSKKPASDNDRDWAIEEAKDLLRLIDKANQIPTQKGTWE